MGGSDSPANRKLHALVARQGGVVTRTQLRDHGVTDRQIDVMVKARRLIRLHQGVYAVGHRPTGRASWFTAGLLAVPGSALSHSSAAEVWGFAVVPDLRRVHLTTDVRSRTSTKTLAVHRVRSLDPLDVEKHRGLRLTTPARTLLDRADQLSEEQLEAEASKAKLLKLINARGLTEMLKRSLGRRTRKLAACAGLATPTRSTFERRLLRELHARALPLPVTNTEVHGWEVDAYWPELELVVELDSWSFHNDKRVFRRDRQKDRALRDRCVEVRRYTWEELCDGTLIREIRPNLTARAA